MVAVMITPLAYSYTEKQEVELEILLNEYLTRDPDKDGRYSHLPLDVELVDFKKLTQDELDVLNEELSNQNLKIEVMVSNIKTQNEIIQKEEQKLVQAQQMVQDEWNAPPVDNTQLKIEYEKLEKITDELDVLLDERQLLEKKIDTKELLLEIQKHDAKLIGVELSQNCINMAKLGNSTCPTYKDLLSLDNSNTEISGDFSVYDGYFHREPSLYVDSFRFYDTEDTIRVIVNPHQELSLRIKMIIIESGFGLYTDAYDQILESGLRTLKKDRIINNCYSANISSDNWKLLLPDTIFAFRNGCSSMEINDEVKYKMPYTVIDKSTSPNIQHQEWLKEAVENCKELC